LCRNVFRKNEETRPFQTWFFLVREAGVETSPLKNNKMLKRCQDMDALIYGLLAVSFGLSIWVIIRNIKK